MNWDLIFIVSLVVFAGFTAAAIVFAGQKKYKSRLLTWSNLLFAGTFLSACLLLLPVSYDMLKSSGSTGFAKGLETFLFSVHNTFQLFTVDADKQLIINNVKASGGTFSGAYAAVISAFYVFAPVFTFVFLLSFFNELKARLRLWIHCFRDVYVFSELNERTASLGRDIKKNHKKAVLVYTDVYGKKEETSPELIEKVGSVRAIFFKKEVTALNIRRKKAAVCFFVFGEDESENTFKALTLTEKYKDRKNVSIYVASTGVEGGLLYSNVGKDGLKVRRINRYRLLVDRELYENGESLFKNALPCEDGKKKISAVIVGLGRYGTEMLKALCWYCQMDGYSVEINAFDIDRRAKDKFAALAPELMAKEYNGVSVPGEAEYTVNIYPGYDVNTKSFADRLAKIKNVTYALVAIGDDSVNIKAAFDLRMYFERMKVHPVIQAVVYNVKEKEVLGGLTNYRGQKYDIGFIGDIDSEEVIMHSGLEDEALSRHLKWGDEDEFWRYEYNYDSSIASAIHRHARIACGIPGASKKEEELTEEERTIIEMIEHRRWNAYMRSEGYVFSGSKEKSSRNDLGKMHHDLVKFAELDDTEKRKDSSVGTN